MENDLETVAKRRVQARMGFVIHALMYIATNAGLVLIWYLTGAHYPWFLWPMLGWGIGLVGHALAFAFGPDSTGEQRAVEREVRRLRAANR